MQRFANLSWILLSCPLILAGCLSESPPKPASPAASNKGAAGEKAKAAEKAKPVEKTEEGDEIQANLAKLSPEDRKLAEAQKVCVESDEPLGGMGVPVKIMVKDQPVFLCCNDCKKAVLADPDKALAKLEMLKGEGKKPTKKLRP